MTLSAKLDHLHFMAKQNKWLKYFAVFNRLTLALGFTIAGMVKIMGERFAAGLSANHPMGHYLEALSLTGYYYPFIGVLQVLAAVMLLIPRTATLGAIIYFPIILNICVLSLAVRFDGSLLSSPLMVLANLYLLCWDYDRIKYILPFKQPAIPVEIPKEINRNKFHFKFFAGVVAAIVVLVMVLNNVYDIMPRNTLSGCMIQCKNSKSPKGCSAFCDSIHIRGQSLDKSLDQYHKALKVK